MKTHFLTLCAVLCAGSAPAAQTNDVEQLKKQLSEMRERFERSQREQQRQLEELSRRIELLQPQPAALPGAPGTPPTDDRKKLEADLAAELAANAPPAPKTANAANSSPLSAPAPFSSPRAGGSYMNISFDALIDAGYSTARDPSAFLNLGDHDPIKRGFSLRNAEIALDGAVDPYFKGFANIVFKLDRNNGTDLELEETFLQSTSLPWNLQLKGGQFFAAFGRQNPQHPHQWAFVDAPIILTRSFGPDGLRSVGAQLSWLAPTPFFTELSLGVFDGQGGTSFNFRNPEERHGRPGLNGELTGLGDLVFVPRLASSFDLSDEQTVVAGLSAAFGPNDTAPHARSQIFGADLYWKWKAPNAMEGFPFLSWQTEALYSRFEAGQSPTLPAETIRDYGFYSQVLWGFKPHWVAGLRGEFASGNSALFDPFDSFRGERYRLSPVLTWYPSEFSKLRLQYNYDHGQYFGTAHSLWLQMEFLLGAHGAHKF